ncbi:MAG TPA: aminotransferase class III-fold pyridoxal phosphate-dependent enzyme [Rhodocyclaceae bacterium]|nr:aminotransferase class III-fold pyridoxal phosphate-dependent enzyme [Rhodocyclaceae bacterium]
MSTRYQNSEAMLARAEAVIPLGTQTFSKSRTQYPFGVSPYFIKRGDGCRVWDVDGNEYVDFVNALCSINLGYNDPDVNAAVRSQLEDGTIFTLPHELEILAAEKLVEMVPCAEKVRFGKNGSDATSGAIRLARAYTGRDRVAVCGYHGWQDWYIGSTARWRGVPEAVRALTHAFPYNDLEALDRLLSEHPGQFAAVILEPMNVVDPKPGYLEGVRELVHRHGALLVFDETITGFRFARGGAQELFGVTPDLATFGKAMANGFPVSAVVGRADIMKLMEEIFFSFTFGGETLSLAAALATMEKVRTTNVVEHLATQGSKIQQGLQGLIAERGLGHVFSVAGHPAWSFTLISDSERYSSWQIKTLLLQEMFSRGVLTLGTHNVSYAHRDQDIERLLSVYAEVLDIVADGLRQGRLEQLLRCQPLEPLFKVR